MVLMLENRSPVPVFEITPSTPNAYFMPGADPGEGYSATNDQLWASDTAPASGTDDRAALEHPVADPAGRGRARLR
ncbi:MAG: hypothetical protein ACRDN0_27860 [Trebonia sp.]